MEFKGIAGGLARNAILILTTRSARLKRVPVDACLAFGPSAIHLHDFKVFILIVIFHHRLDKALLVIRFHRGGAKVTATTHLTLQTRVLRLRAPMYVGFPHVPLRSFGHSGTRLLPQILEARIRSHICLGIMCSFCSTSKFFQNKLESRCDPTDGCGALTNLNRRQIHAIPAIAVAPVLPYMGILQ